MDYQCQNFVDGQVLTAECLNRMEKGIENACKTPGPQGPKGDDGVSISHEWDGPVLKITSASGTSSANLRGPTGPIGIKGNPGKDAYEYARDGGYMGSEAKFSEQLAGIPDWDKVDTYTANDTIVISQQSVSSGMWTNRQRDIEPGIPYAVYINGTEYFCIAGEEDGTIYLGNPTLFYSASTLEHNNEPFCITWAGGAATAGMFFKDSTLSYPITLKVTGAAVTTEKKLPVEYLPDDVAMKSDIPEGGGGGGSASIDVTASVGQTIVVEEVDADGKPTKWKAAEFQERTHWSEIREVQPSTTITPFYYEALGVPMGQLSNFDIVVGNKYKVKFDGVEYICEAFIASMAGISAPAFGNTAVAGGANTGEPFAIFKMAGDEWTTAIFFDMNPHTVQVFAESVTPIPVQYVTNAFPYYIDVTGSGTDSDPYVCNDTVENVEALFDSGRTVCVRTRIYADSGLMYSEALYSYHLRSMESEAGYTICFIANSYKSANVSLHRLDLIPQTDGTYTVNVMELT